MIVTYKGDMHRVRNPKKYKAEYNRIFSNKKKPEGCPHNSIKFGKVKVCNDCGEELT